MHASDLLYDWCMLAFLHVGKNNWRINVGEIIKSGKQTNNAVQDFPSHTYAHTSLCRTMLSTLDFSFSSSEVAQFSCCLALSRWLERTSIWSSTLATSLLSTIFACISCCRSLLVRSANEQRGQQVRLDSHLAFKAHKAHSLLSFRKRVKNKSCFSRLLTFSDGYF